MPDNKRVIKFTLNSAYDMNIIMIIRREDFGDISELLPNSRKKVLFTCDRCGKKSYRLYCNYIKNEVNLCRSCLTKEINNKPEIKEKNKNSQKERWKTANRKTIGENISKGQKEAWKRNGKRIGRSRLPFEIIKQSFQKEKYQLLTTEEEYKGVGKTYLKYICTNGHKRKIKWDKWKMGQRCGLCAKNSPLSFEYIIESFKKEGYNLLTKEEDFVSVKKTKLFYICNNGHKHYTYWDRWLAGHRCPYCANNARINYDDFKKAVESENYKIFTDKSNYNNSKSKIVLICPHGHKYVTNWNNWNSGYRCSECQAKLGTSKAEKEIANFISNELNFEILTNNRSILMKYNLELDIVIPSKKIAIEYCGIYWHSQITGNKEKNYHYNKLLKANSCGYRLITIFEDEWINKKEIVKKRLKHILGCENITIYARKCKIVNGSVNSVRNFLNNNHIQGYARSNVRLYAIYNNEIVSAMTFLKKKSGIWELNRFCSIYNVIGIASKLLKYFKDNYDWKSIISFADRRWSDGDLYNKIGFSLENYIPPSYSYFHRKNNLIRYHKSNFRRNHLKDRLENFDPNLSEWENMKIHGWDRIWDCGNLKFVLLL